MKAGFMGGIQNENKNIEELLSTMSLEDKVAYGSGKDFWHTKDMPKYGIESLMMADGPHGLRKQIDSTDMLGINKSVPAPVLCAPLIKAAAIFPVRYGSSL